MLQPTAMSSGPRTAIRGNIGVILSEWGVGIGFQLFLVMHVDRNCHCDTPLTLEKHSWRALEAVAEPFYLLSVQLTLFSQDQGHYTLAAQILCKILLSKSIRIHQFFQHFDARNIFDGEMLVS